MSRSRVVLALCAALLFSVLPARAERRFIVRATGGLTPLESACRLIGCSSILALNDPHSQVFLITIPHAMNPLALIAGIGKAGVINVEADLAVSLVAPSNVRASYTPGLFDRTPMVYYGGTVWQGYAQQPPAHIVRVEEARRTYGVDGRGPVAIIDTGVDPNHPALRDALLPGYDFTRDQAGTGSEMGDVNQSTTAVVDDGTARPVNSSTIAVVSQSTTAVVDDPGFAAFGHGTMVAGIVHLVAPRATIVPIKAFRANGQGYLSDILRATYWAVKAGSRVINMSFSLPSYSREFEAALKYAASQRVICIASVGNDGRKALTYPAAFDSVIGVASTNWGDKKSSFSNYGSNVVSVAAPGEAIVSTYPFGSYAAGWGTSFAAPFVSGTAALLIDANGAIDGPAAAKALSKAKPLERDLGSGRLDAYQATGAARFGK
jgi:subtilisin family serine protease